MRLRKKYQLKNAPAAIRYLASSQRGAEILEIAITLPIFLLMIIGIIDFGGAWAARDQIEGSARNGARASVAAFNDTTNPQCGGGPCSVQVAVDAAIAALNNANLPTCGMTDAGIGAAGTFTWSDTAGCPNGGTFTITVNRAFPVPDNSTGTPITVLTTQVTVSYPYTFKLNMGGGLAYAANPFAAYTTLKSTVTMVNQN